MQLLAVLIGNNRSTCSSGIYHPNQHQASPGVFMISLMLTSCYDNTSIEYAPHNGSTGGRSSGQRQTPGMQRNVTGVVGEVEARHFQEL